MPVTIAHERLKIYVLEVLIDKIFNKHMAAITEGFNKLVDENNTFYERVDYGNCFKYKGKRYDHSWRLVSVQRNLKPKNQLDNSLHTRADKLIKDKYAADTTKLIVKSYVIEGLNLCTNMEDIFIVFPEIITNYLPKNLMIHKANINNSYVCAAKLKIFRKKSESQLDKVKEFIMTNLLLQGQ